MDMLTVNYGIDDIAIFHRHELPQDNVKRELSRVRDAHDNICAD